MVEHVVSQKVLRLEKPSLWIAKREICYIETVFILIIPFSLLAPLVALQSMLRPSEKDVEVPVTLPTSLKGLLKIFWSFMINFEAHFLFKTSNL